MKQENKPNEEMQNAVRVFDLYKFQGIIPPKESDDYGLYKYGEWIVKNML